MGISRLSCTYFKLYEQYTFFVNCDMYDYNEELSYGVNVLFFTALNLPLEVWGSLMDV